MTTRTREVDAASLSYAPARSLTQSPLAKAPEATPAAIRYVVARAIREWEDEPERDALGRTKGGDDLAATLHANLGLTEPPFDPVTHARSLAEAHERSAAALTNCGRGGPPPTLAEIASKERAGAELWELIAEDIRRGGGEAA
jgi:hypothetical protein